MKSFFWEVFGEVARVLLKDLVWFLGCCLCSWLQIQHNTFGIEMIAIHNSFYDLWVYDCFGCYLLFISVHGPSCCFVWLGSLYSVNTHRWVYQSAVVHILYQLACLNSVFELCVCACLCVYVLYKERLLDDLWLQSFLLLNSTLSLYKGCDCFSRIWPSSRSPAPAGISLDKPHTQIQSRSYFTPTSKDTFHHEIKRRKWNSDLVVKCDGGVSWLFLWDSILQLYKT